ncbi:GNAT family N-acetyltransferase [Halomonas sp. M20]|uniref:GNAT family N-acetyltransferase n=1 Tax=Halomonas sp. M20 TaxID=2763264 RepID=UPI001D0B5B53|nr:GNAT family N-acetyltransferase [Halomonas sp. M20]
MSPSLRPACPDDLDALCRLELESFEGDRFNRRQLTHLLTRAHATTWVVENKSGRLLGYGTLLFRRNSRSARLYSFCVHPEARGKGIGRRIAERLEQESRERALQKLILEVRADNRRAIGLYRRLGFLPRRWLDDYYSDGCAAWQMDKVLEPEDAVGLVVAG